MLNLTTLIGIVITLVVGVVLKKWPSFPNKFIPVASFVISILTQLINGFQQAPPPAPVHAMAIGYTMLVGSFLSSGFVKLLLNSLLQTLIATGTHSTAKNVVQGLKNS